MGRMVNIILMVMVENGDDDGDYAGGVDHAGGR